MRNVHRFNPAIIFNANFTIILLQEFISLKFCTKMITQYRKCFTRWKNHLYSFYEFYLITVFNISLHIKLLKSDSELTCDEKGMVRLERTDSVLSEEIMVRGIENRFLHSKRTAWFDFVGSFGPPNSGAECKRASPYNEAIECEKYSSTTSSYFSKNRKKAGSSRSERKRVVAATSQQSFWKVIHC